MSRPPSDDSTNHSARLSDLEAALRASEERYRIIFDNAAVGMAEASPEDGRLLLVNRRMTEITGYTREELLRMRFPEITHPEDRERDFREFQRMVRGETHSYVSEKRYLRKDGRFALVHVTGTAVRDAHGRPLHSIAVIRDITPEVAARTALADAERRLAAITNNATLGLVMMDARQQCVFMNPAAERITGFSFHEVQGRPLHEFVHHTRPDGRPYPMEECPIDRALPTRAQEQGEEIFVHRDGHFYPVAFTASPIIEAGRAVGTIIELRDTTDEKRRQREREQLLGELKEAVRLRDEFLSVASHELKTPLTPLALKLAALEKVLVSGARSNAEELRREVDVARRQVRRLSDLVNDLLDVSRISSGRLNLELEQVNLVDVVSEVVRRFEPEAIRAGCSIELRTGAPAVGTWDRLRLEQVVGNLLSNAIKYGAGHPIRVDVEQTGDAGRLRICDEGIGIPPEVMARLFQKFERGVSDRHYGGLGLGLYVTRQIVEAFGGTVRATSEGLGATFEVIIPLRATAAR